MTKTILTCFILAFLCVKIHAQDLKFRTVKASYKVGDGNWTNWQKHEFLGIVSGAKERITIYSEPKEVFEIISKNVTNLDKELLMSLNCIDIEGEECIVEIRADTKNSTFTLYVRYTNAILAIIFNELAH